MVGVHGATPSSGQLRLPRRQHPSFVGLRHSRRDRVAVARNRGLGVAVACGRVEPGRGRALHLDRVRLAVVGVERLAPADVEGSAFFVQGILFTAVVIQAIAWI